MYMPNVNLRGISAELHGQLKARAALENVTLQSLCVRFFWQGLDRWKEPVVQGVMREPDSATKIEEEIPVAEEEPQQQTAKEKFLQNPRCPRGTNHRFLPSGENFWCVDCKVLYEMEEGDE